MLQESSKLLKHISKLSIRQLFSNIRSQSDETQTSDEATNESLSGTLEVVRRRYAYRLSEFDFSPFTKAFRHPKCSSYLSQIHLVPQTPSTLSPVEAVTGNLDVGELHHINAPSDATISPSTPNPLSDHRGNSQNKLQ